MGNFEKLSVLVIGVIIVMILVVALYTWTDDPAEPDASVPVVSAGGALEGPSIAGLTGDGTTVRRDADPESEDGWLTWVDDPAAEDPASRQDPLVEDRLLAAQDQPSADETADDTTPGESAAEGTYTVKPRQTLSHISLEVYGTIKHWPKIAERNNVDPNRLREGMVLIIPVIDAATPASTNKPVALAASGGSRGSPTPGGDYVVRDGDTMQKISQAAFGTIERWDDIWIQNLERIEDPRFLRAGTTLRIPN